MANARRALDFVENCGLRVTHLIEHRIGIGSRIVGCHAADLYIECADGQADDFDDHSVFGNLHDLGNVSLGPCLFD